MKNLQASKAEAIREMCAMPGWAYMMEEYSSVVAKLKQEVGNVSFDRTATNDNIAREVAFRHGFAAGASDLRRWLGDTVKALSQGAVR